VGRNIAGIRASREEEGLFSVPFNEFERVLIAAGFIFYEHFLSLVVPLAYDALSATDAWQFFHLREIDVTQDADLSREIRLKPGGFQDYIDLFLYVDARHEVRVGRLRMSRSWVEEKYPFALDLAKSIIGTLMPRE
jgi:hypothetical protein